MSSPGRFVLYTAPDGAVKVDVFFRDETVWLTQKALAELFGSSARPTHNLLVKSDGHEMKVADRTATEH